MQNSPSNENDRQTNVPWSRGKCRFVSVLIAGHLLAVFVAPWSAPPPAPLLAQSFASALGPYQSATYINHGYRFFAPNPGPSHIVRYEVTKPDGTTITGQVPDPSYHWPRLLYHRHFMMTESLFSTWSQIEQIPAEAEVSPEDRQLVEERNGYAQRLINSMTSGMAHQLLKRHQGDRVELTLVEHQIPYPQAVLEGQPLDDASLYVDLAKLGSYPNDELPSP